MKRSEMVNKITEIMDRIYTIQNIDSLEKEELSDWLLREIEKAGMLPPDNKKLREANEELWHYNIWEEEE